MAEGRGRGYRSGRRWRHAVRTRIIVFYTDRWRIMRGAKAGLTRSWRSCWTSLRVARHQLTQSFSAICQWRLLSRHMWIVTHSALHVWNASSRYVCAFRLPLQFETDVAFLQPFISGRQFCDVHWNFVNIKGLDKKWKWRALRRISWVLSFDPIKSDSSPSGCTGTGYSSGYEVFLNKSEENGEIVYT